MIRMNKTLLTHIKSDVSTQHTTGQPLTSELSSLLLFSKTPALKNKLLVESYHNTDIRYYQIMATLENQNSRS